MTPSKSSQWGLFCSRLFSQCQLLLSKWVFHTINSKWVLVLKQWPASKHESNLSPSPRVVPQRFQSFSGPRLTPQRLCRPCCCNANGLHGRTQTSGHVSTTAVGWRVWLSPLSGKVSTTLPGSGNQFLFSSIGSFVNTIRNWAPWWAVALGASGANHLSPRQFQNCSRMHLLKIPVCFGPQSYVTTRFSRWFSAWQQAEMCIFLHACHVDSLCSSGPFSSCFFAWQRANMRIFYHACHADWRVLWDGFWVCWGGGGGFGVGGVGGA